jgi:hypothetical protein
VQLLSTRSDSAREDSRRGLGCRRRTLGGEGSGVLVLVEFERRDDRERNRRSSILAKALTEVDGFCSFLLEACVEVGGCL